ncbi:MFS transporter [Cytobacillus gottheilii]|uniref:MFS transporter n=1 Tax=Cytobacillus gottheilii TaxID=859144 RepID=A0ABX8F6Q5_9BACI|nr:MFS transporter [Cytobacillus gottheilii]QVY60118.1 MFS transporter [Cytobacillus gottheilii]
MRFFILLIVFISFFDMFSQLPIMSTYAKGLGAGSAIIGIIVGMYSFSNMIGNMLAGYYIDRSRGKTILMIGLGLCGAILFLYPFAVTPAQLLGIRFLHGFISGFIVPAAFTMIANRSESGTQGKSMAITGAAVGIAAIAGPAFGGIAGSGNVQTVFIVNGILMLLTAAAVPFFIPKQGVSGASSEKKAANQSGRSISSLMIFSFIGAFSLMFAQGVLAYMLPLQVEMLQFSSSASGTLLSTFGITAICIFILPTNKLYDKYKPFRLMTLGMSVIGFALLLLSNSTSLLMLYVSMVIYGLGFAWLFPSISALLIQQTAPEARGRAFGYFYAFFSLGSVAGSAITGALTVSFKSGFLIAACLLFGNVLWMSLYNIWKNLPNKV